MLKNRYRCQVKISATVTEYSVGISIVYRYTCVYNVKIYWKNTENVICLTNKEYTGVTDEVR